MSSVLLFAANDGGTGFETWLTNAAGTSATLIDLFPGPNGSVGSLLSKTLDGELFFEANNGQSGTELYKSDGTVAGTQLFTDMEFGPGSSFPFTTFPEQTIVVGDSFYFSPFVTTTGQELYKLDAGASAPVLVRDIFPGNGSSIPDWMADLNGTLIFSANDGTSGTELYKSDGTEAGTQRVADIFTGAGSSNPIMFDTNVLNNRVFFSADDGTNGNELWSTDGTTAGTALVRDINPGAGSSTFGPDMAELNGNLYFAADNGTNGFELWRTDGTEGGTNLVKDINPGAGGSGIGRLTELNGELLFFADNGSTGTELWKTDGSSTGTTLVRDIFPGATGSFFNSTNADFDPITLFNGKGYFIADDGSNGVELWETDGTTGGTRLFKDINPGGGDAFVNNLAVADDLMYFSADNGTNGMELWVTDGTDAGTRIVQDVRVGSQGSNAAAIGVIDINVAPDAPTLTGDSISENFAPGTVVGTLSATDLDGDLLILSLTDNAGGRFAVNGDQLVTTQGLDFEAAQSHDVTVQVADPDGLTASATFTINVTNVVEAPTVPTLDTNTVAENSANGTTVGTIASANPEGGAVILSLLDNANGLFALNGTSLQVAGALDFETGPSQSVTVRSAGAGNTFTDATFTIGVTNVNEAPGAVTLANQQAVTENAAAGAVVGTVGATDPDGDTLTFSLTNNAGGQFTLNGTTLQTTAPLDFEAGATRSVTVQAADAGGLTSEQTFTVNVTDVDENRAPGAVTLANQQAVAENLAAGAVVGTVGAIDPDGDTVTFTLTNNAGGQFTLNGTTLQTTGPLDFEAGATRSVTVQAADPAGLTSEQTFTINVTDVEETVDLLLNGTPGNDTLTGGAGNDTINGLDGTDDLIGGAGNDSITGGVSENDLRDNIFGGDGNDTIRGGYGNDNVRGDAGDDLVEGGFGADTVLGGEGNDSITGSGFGDLLFGADGDDFINGGFGFDRVNGGDGADEFFHLGVEGHGTDFIQDYDASEGDVLVFGNTAASAGQFQINLANTPNAGDGSIEEAFIIYRPTGQIMWALIDGAAQDEINLQIAGQVFDLTG